MDWKFDMEEKTYLKDITKINKYKSLQIYTWCGYVFHGMGNAVGDTGVGTILEAQFEHLSLRCLLNNL